MIQKKCIFYIFIFLFLLSSCKSIIDKTYNDKKFFEHLIKINDEMDKLDFEPQKMGYTAEDVQLMAGYISNHSEKLKSENRTYREIIGLAKNEKMKNDQDHKPKEINSLNTKDSINSKPHYLIEKKDDDFPRKIEFIIRIDNNYSKDQIKIIAEEIYSSLTKKYNKVFIMYLTPEMNDNQGAYATSHYDPNLVINVLGLDNKQIKKIVQNQVNTKNIIGQWEINIMQCIYSLRKENHKFFLEEKYTDGSSREYQIFEKKINGHIGYSETFDERDGYYTIEKNGNLIHRNINGEEGYVYAPIKK